MTTKSQIDFVEHALLLKSLPALADANPDQLAAILEAVRERSFAPGATLLRPGETPTEVHIIVEGKVRLVQEKRTVWLGRGDVVGVLGALEQRPQTVLCLCDSAVQTLSVRIDDFFDLMEDFFDLARAMMGFLARRVIEVGAAHQFHDGEGAAFSARARPVSLIERLVFMKSVPLLAGGSMEELARLAAEATEVEFGAGEVVYAEGAPADAFWLVLSGRLGPYGPRTSAGAIDVLAQVSHRETVVATEPSLALRIPAERFFDLVEDHIDLMRRLTRDLGRVVRAHFAALVP